MVPVMNRPLMEYSVELLQKHGFREIAVTLQYLPDQIKDHFGDGSRFGLNLRYFVEEEPLGTAGSVKNAASMLDETFIVISGDALTDLDVYKRQGLSTGGGGPGSDLRINCCLCGFILWLPPAQAAGDGCPAGSPG